jgi:hypothetical protein
MTPHTAAAARLTLDPATTDVTLATIFAALRFDPDRTPAQHQTQREAAAEMIATLQPRDPVEASYATRAVAAHFGSVECFRRAALPDTPDNVALRLFGRAESLSRMSTEMVRMLRQRQAETAGAQPQPAARPSMPALPASATAPRPAAPVAETPLGRQDPMPSERPHPAPAATPAATPQAATPPQHVHATPTSALARPAAPASRLETTPTRLPAPAAATSPAADINATRSDGTTERLLAEAAARAAAPSVALAA